MAQIIVNSKDPIVPLHVVEKLLKTAVPDWEWFFFSPTLQPMLASLHSPMNRVIKNLAIQGYPRLYEDERKIVASCLLGVCTLDQIREFSTEFEGATLEERGEALDEFSSELSQMGDVSVFFMNRRQLIVLRREFRALPLEQQRLAIQQARYFWSGMIATYHQVLSLVFHGEKMTTLIAKAKLGDDQSLLKAVQIDSRVLYEIPYFAKRYERSQLEPNSSLRMSLGYRTFGAPQHGRIRHRTAWLTLAILDWLGWLRHLSYPELLRLFDASGIGSATREITDETSMGKIVRMYWERHTLAPMSTQ
ncbi:MAG: hypothetical protein V4607_16415 [Pseudomonadota bacterium]